MATSPSLENWEEKAKAVRVETRLFIDGQYSESASGETFPCMSPIDGREIAAVSAGGSEDIDRAVKAARSAFQKGVWRKLPPAKRKRILLAFADLMQTHAEELALLETLDMGKPIRYSQAVDIAGSINCLRWFAESIDKVYDEVAPAGDSALATITREPIGVVGAVVPWNFPLLMAMWKIAPVLATGNSLVLKPAEQSPLTAIRIASLAIEAGIPPGVFNVVPGLGATAGQALGRHMDVDAVTFTGSTEVGKYFLKYSGESNMKTVSLECGGKTPNIVMADAPDLDAAAKSAAFGIFFNTGQVCNAGSRLLVQTSIKDEFLEKVLAAGKKMRYGNPLDPSVTIGSIVDETQTQRVMGYIEKGTQEGASLVLGGQQVLQETGGFYIEPTVFDQVSNKMTIAQEEIFGPVLSVLSFTEAEQAIQIANDSMYGLAAAVWTRDISTAIKTSRELRAGTVWVNCFDTSDVTVPFGGYKQSGFGRDKSLHAMEKYTQLKTTWIAVN
ncbi:MAG TPA: aldehyde dehydrogenase PuuC [Gammaproteobacteria bacterium]|nr:aldehyde dehydrogenase PuuC [Gammaproteobacteria bacterium]